MICQHLIDSKEDICERCFDLDFVLLKRHAENIIALVKKL